MKKILLLTFSLLALAGCGKSDDSDKKTEQELWLDGYIGQYGDKDPEAISFLFFPAGNGEKYITEAHQLPGELSYYEYLQLQEDPIYTRLIDKQSIERTDGVIVKATHVVTDYNILSAETTSTTLPVGKYFIVALRFERGYDRHIWNKYTTLEYNLEPRYNPQALSCVISVDFSTYGCVPWRQWNEL
jgi:hypothetical protein